MTFVNIKDKISAMKARRRRARPLARPFLEGSLLFVSTLSFVSVGFSSFVFFPGSSSLNGFEIEAGQVIDLSALVSFKPIAAFEFCPHGLIEDETIVYEGDIEGGFHLPFSDGVLSYLSTASSLDFRVALSYLGGFDLFASDFLGETPSLAAEFSTDGYPSLASSTVTRFSAVSDGRSIESTFSWPIAEAEGKDGLYCSFSIALDFSSVAASFETDVYPFLSGSNFRFLLSVEPLNE